MTKQVIKRNLDAETATALRAKEAVEIALRCFAEAQMNSTEEEVGEWWGEMSRELMVVLGSVRNQINQTGRI